MNRWQAGPTAGVSAIPLIDVLLVLLVACIPVLAGDRLNSLPLELPTAAGDRAPDQRWVVTVDQAGGLGYEGGSVASIAQLATRVPKGSAIELAAHPALKTESLARILGELQAAGFSRVSLITKAQ